MFALVMTPRRARLLLSIPLGIAVGVALAQVAGLGDNSQVLGIPLGRQTVPQAAGDWKDALHREADAHELRDWHIDGFSGRLGHSPQARQAYYRARLVGTVHGRPVTVDVELRAEDRAEWQLVEWSERR